MITTMIVLGILTFMLWVGFKVTGALFAALFWLVIKLPLALCLWTVGMAFCCTIILIPVGICLFKAGGSLLFMA